MTTQPDTKPRYLILEPSGDVTFLDEDCHQAMLTVGPSVALAILEQLDEIRHQLRDQARRHGYSEAILHVAQVIRATGIDAPGIYTNTAGYLDTPTVDVAVETRDDFERILSAAGWPTVTARRQFGTTGNWEARATDRHGVTWIGPATSDEITAAENTERVAS